MSNEKKKILGIYGIIFWIISLTWGGVITWPGLVAVVGLMITGHCPKRYGFFLYFEAGRSWGGMNLGPVCVVNKEPGTHILQHEAGHGLQNMIYGIFMPIIVAIPSVVRYLWRSHIYHIDRKWYGKLPAYESIWFEKQATDWGKRMRRSWRETD